MCPIITIDTTIYYILSTAQYNTLQCNTTQYNTIQYNTIQYNAMVQILIRNVLFTTTKSQLVELFKNYGLVQADIENIKICRPRGVNVGKEECTVCVDLRSLQTAEMLVNATNGQVLPGVSGRAVDSRLSTAPRPGGDTTTTTTTTRPPQFFHHPRALVESTRYCLILIDSND